MLKYAGLLPNDQKGYDLVAAATLKPIIKNINTGYDQNGIDWESIKKEAAAHGYILD